MRAAIYARKSTDDNDKNPENKSVARQVESARAYLLGKGWDYDEDLVFVDDGVSGAEYVNRPGFARLMTSLRQFDVLVMGESSRLGRDMTRNAAFMLDILEHGKRIFYYLSDEEEKADTPEQKILVTLRSYASEVERLKAGQRSRDALRRKIEHGYNAGGRVYGYDNVPVFAKGADGETRKSHTEYRINAAEADAIRRIFRMYAAGYGHVTVAKTLNREPRRAELLRQYFDDAPPSPPRKRTGSWAPSSIREMLYNERYAGVIEWGEYRKIYRKGTKARVKQAESERIRVERPELRIVDEDLWREVQARLAAVRKTYVRDNDGRLWGRPGTGVESKYLLTGLAECGCCGHNMVMVGGKSGSPGKRKRAFYYGCSYHVGRGRAVCANEFRVNMDEADRAVLDRVRRTVLTPEAIDFTVEEAIRLLAERRKQTADLPERHEAELRKERRQLDNLVAAVAEGTAPAIVMEKIRALEERIRAKEGDLATFAVKAPSELDLRRVRRAFRERLGQFNELMRSDAPVARQALRKLLVGRIVFKPVEVQGLRSYHLQWSYTLKALIDQSYIGVASPRGFEPLFAP